MRFFILFFLLLPSLYSKADFIVSDTTERILIGKNFYVYQGETDRLTFEDIKNSPNFIMNQSDVPNFGISKKNSWLRFTINNQSSRSHYLLDVAYPILDEIELFVPDEAGNYRSI